MNKEDIILMASESGVLGGYEGEPVLLERFAALVAAHEREACAQLILDSGFRSNGVSTYEHHADMIRARGKV